MPAVSEVDSREGSALRGGLSRLRRGRTQRRWEGQEKQALLKLAGVSWPPQPHSTWRNLDFTCYKWKAIEALSPWISFECLNWNCTIASLSWGVTSSTGVINVRTPGWWCHWPHAQECLGNVRNGFKHGELFLGVDSSRPELDLGELRLSQEWHGLSVCVKGHPGREVDNAKAGPTYQAWAFCVYK